MDEFTGSINVVGFFAPFVDLREGIVSCWAFLDRALYSE